MDLALNSTKSMDCLKGYSAKPYFVLTRGVGWKLPTTATHYTSVPVRFYFPQATRRFPRTAARGATLPLLPWTVPPPPPFPPPAGRPDRRRCRRWAVRRPLLLSIPGVELAFPVLLL
jgi:hypothetical protein